jgi:membrane protease YdiL (CAAX protease family)
MAETPENPSLPRARPILVARPVHAQPVPALPSSAPVPAWEGELAFLTRREALLDLFLVFLAAIATHYLPALLLRALAHQPMEAPPTPIVFLTSKWAEMGLAVGLAAYLVLRHRLPAAAIGLRSAGLLGQLAWGMGSLAGCYLALLGTAALVTGLVLAFPQMGQEIRQRMDFVGGLPQDNTWVLLLVLMAVAVHEEVVFRALLLPYLRRLTGAWWPAVLLSTAVFAGLHVPTQGLLGGLQVAAVGAALSLFFILSRSLLAVTLAHFLFNALQLLLSNYLIHHFQEAFDRLVE